VVRGCDLSDVFAGQPVAHGGLGEEGLARLQRDLRETLIVNAASLNATVSMHQHGLEVVQDPVTGRRHCRLSAKVQEWVDDKGDLTNRLRTLRPPIVVDVWPRGLPHINGGRGAFKLVPLGVERFPEFYGPGPMQSPPPE
jgi:hypothetical protein